MNTAGPGDARIRLVVLGSSGRAGQAVLSRLDRSEIDVVEHATGRYSTRDHDRFDADLSSALENGDVVLNLAGVAHLDPSPSPADLDRLAAANVSMPLLVARRCLEHGVALIHVSSSKADDPTTPYGWSKAVCDASLETSFGASFETAGLPLVIVKPPALLIGPFDAGKLRKLRWIDRVPKRLLPNRPMPVLSSTRFVDRVERLVEQCGDPSNPQRLDSGVHTVRWSDDDLDGLAAIHDAMRDTRKNRQR